MSKPNFVLPKTKTCFVVWYRDGKKNETLIDTPATTDKLFNVMLGHKVGFSEIRAVKKVDGHDLAEQIQLASLRRW
jgi:hypothetical protein